MWFFNLIWRYLFSRRSVVEDRHIPLPSVDPEEPAVVLKRGDAGSKVKFLQEMLNRFVLAGLDIDGDFGPSTEKAVNKAQRTLALEQSPEVSQVMWKVLNSEAFLRVDERLQQIEMAPEKQVDGANNRQKKPLADAWNQYGGLISHIAQKRNIPVSTALAVLAVESAGNAYEDGRPIIRFENHVFWRYWGRRFREQFETHFQFDRAKSWQGHFWRPTEDGEWIKQHYSTSMSQGQKAEWETFEFARTLEDTAAIYSISIGAPQIMGFNHRKIGYENPQEMLEAFEEDARWHVLGFFDFLKDDAKMIQSLRKGDFVTFASIYNGPGQSEDYGAKIKAAAKLALTMGI